MEFDKECDASGLACPLPIVKAKKALAGMQPGQVLRLISTDSGSIADVPVLAQSGGHALLASADEGGRYVFLLRRG